MSREYTTVIGSGQRPHVANVPPYNIAEGTFPVPDQRHDYRTRSGEGSVVLNPEDFSVSIGGRVTQATISSAAVELLVSPLENRRSLAIHNGGASTVYLGFSAAVTTANGFPLIANEKIAIDMTGNPNMRIWAISAGSSDLRLLEVA